MVFPVPICPVVLQPPVNQYTVPTAPFAVKVVEAHKQIVCEVAVIDVGGLGTVQLDTPTGTTILAV